MLLVQVVYETQLGGADDGALQEAALHQRAERVAVAAGLPAAAPLSPSREASLACKNTASGSVKDVKFFDLDTCFWQLAQQHSLRYNTYDSSTIPALGGCCCRPGSALPSDELPPPTCSACLALTFEQVVAAPGGRARTGSGPPGVCTCRVVFERCNRAALPTCGFMSACGRLPAYLQAARRGWRGAAGW